MSDSRADMDGLQLLPFDAELMAKLDPRMQGNLTRDQFYMLLYGMQTDGSGATN